MSEGEVVSVGLEVIWWVEEGMYITTSFKKGRLSDFEDDPAEPLV